MGTGLLGDTRQRYRNVQEKGCAESSKLHGQLCVQTANVKPQQAEIIGCYDT